MRKLILSITVSACMLLPSISVYAATRTDVADITGWEKSFYTVPSEEYSGKVEFVQDGDNPAPNGGRGMMHIWTSPPTGTPNLNANAVQNISGLDKTKTYRLTGDIYYSSNETKLYFTNAEVKKEDAYVTNIDFREFFNPGFEKRWMPLSLDLRPTSENIGLRFTVMANREIYMDNISLREIIYEEDGITIAAFGEQLVVNGDFEADIDDEAPEDVTDVSAENMDGAVKLTWTNPTEDFAKAYIYRAGEEIPIGKTSEKYIVLDGLENNVEYTFIIKASDKLNNLSGGVAVTAKPVPDMLKVSDVAFEIDGKKVNSLSAGTLKATVKLKNNGCPEDFSAELIVVLLKNGALVDVSTAYSVIEASDWREAYTPITAEIEIPQGDEYSVEVYIWSGLGDMITIVDREISLS